MTLILPFEIKLIELEILIHFQIRFSAQWLLKCLCNLFDINYKLNYFNKRRIIILIFVSFLGNHYIIFILLVFFSIPFLVAKFILA